MRRSSRIEIFDPFYCPASSLFLNEASIFPPGALGFPSSFISEHEEVDELSSAFELLAPRASSGFELFDTVTDLIQVEKTPSYCSYKRVQQRAAAPELYLQRISDRVTALESKFEQLVSKSKGKVGDRKYTWTAEINGPVERKYKWMAEIKGAAEKEEEVKQKKQVPVKRVPVEKKYKWTAEIKGKGEESRKYVFEVSSGGDANKSSESGKKDKKKEVKKVEEKKPKKNGVRVVEIEEPEADHGVVVLRQAFAKRAGALRSMKGKNKELSPQDAALLIQITFRAYLIRRSQALRALRDLAIAKAKLKEIRGMFNNFSYRRQVSRDAEERQRFTERIIVLLLTVDSIEQGADLMVRSSKRSMVDELEAMLDVVDPQPAGGRSLSMRRRTFDMPDGTIRKEIAEGVAQVVQMLEQEEEEADE
ncbi:unnamed protein product [Linum tenue]|uniref:BAG family molecular chaperone regulator 7 n=1 Tax=Linum tenue TaxID=586396 RepID=A0AAV0J3X7_9ROSI|nr:unnamed protein product [Linum tenue]CAI0404852.1 unnamed protein product [Linum tenue]